MIWNGDPSGKPMSPTNEVEPAKGSVSSDGNHLWFYKFVSDESVQEMVAALQEVVQAPLPPIHLHIHSYGGETFAGFAAADAILSCPVPVHTHIEGCAASAATIFSVMGSHRTIGPNSYILIHQLQSAFWGKYEEFRDEMKNHDLVMSRLRGIYAERSKLTKAKVNQILKHDLWFDSIGAVQAGLVDEVRKIR
jgi:ATP-dependent Clp protease protease subunit